MVPPLDMKNNISKPLMISFLILSILVRPKENLNILSCDTYVSKPYNKAGLTTSM